MSWKARAQLSRREWCWTMWWRATIRIWQAGCYRRPQRTGRRKTYSKREHKSPFSLVKVSMDSSWDPLGILRRYIHIPHSCWHTVSVWTVFRFGANLEGSFDSWTHFQSQVIEQDAKLMQQINRVAIPH